MAEYDALPEAPPDPGPLPPNAFAIVGAETEEGSRQDLPFGSAGTLADEEERRFLRFPHPPFGWAILWLLLFIVLTQGTAAVLTAGLLIGKAILTHTPVPMNSQEYLNSPEFARLLWPGLLVDKVLEVVLSLAVLRLVAGRDWARQVAFRRPSVSHLGLVLLLFPVVLLMAQAIDELVKDQVPSLFDLDQFLGVVGHWPVWLGVFLIGVGPAFGEELWCRAFLGRGLVGTYGPVRGVLLSSLLFGLMHVEPRQVVYATAIGIVLHFVYLTTRSLWMPILLHLLNNSLSVLASAAAKEAGPGEVATGSVGWWDLSWLSDLSGTVVNHPQGVLAGTVVLMGVLGLALYHSRVRLVPDGLGPILWRPAYPGVECPPPGCGVTTTQALPFWVVPLSALGYLAFFLVCWVLGATYFSVLRGG